MIKISLVIPAFNEADSIKSVLDELGSYMNNYLGNKGWEIVVVNDGSSDNTVEILNDIKKTKEWLKIIDLKLHYGRGKALRTGIENSTGEIIVSLDADLSYAPYHIERLVKKIEEENADIVLASAYAKGGTVKNVPFKRLWISRLGNKILSYMAGGDLTVLTCLVRAYRKSFIKQIDLHSNDKEIHLEILYKSRILGGNIVEVPADLWWREEKLTKIEKKGQIKRRSTIRIKKTSASHLFFALLNKPGFIFWVPGYFLVLFSLVVLSIVLNVIVQNITAGATLYMAIRDSMLTGTFSWFTLAVSFILGIQFLTLGFLTNQIKKNYEETYKTLSAIYAELKKGKE